MLSEFLKYEFIEQYARLKRRPAPPFKIQFYPYSNLTNTIRIRNGRILVRLSDILSDAPPEVLAAALSILLHKLFGKTIPREHNETYDRYTNQKKILDTIRKIRRRRGRKQLTSPQGRFFDLQKLFDGLNRTYFDGQVKIRHLSWSRRRNRRILGHYDAAHQTIVIDRRLDSPAVPRYVLRYVLFHEMLHAYLGEEIHNGKRLVHHRRFQEAEREFPDYRRARKFIEERL